MNFNDWKWICESNFSDIKLEYRTVKNLRSGI